MADSVGATPGEWRVIVAGYAENTLKTTAPTSPLGEQINQQMQACKGEIGNLPGRGGPLSPVGNHDLDHAPRRQPQP